ncbi:threonine--tRNA ligase domain protein, partial [Clostridioides difficile DA00310]
MYTPTWVEPRINIVPNIFGAIFYYKKSKNYFNKEEKTMIKVALKDGSIKEFENAISVMDVA